MTIRAEEQRPAPDGARAAGAALDVRGVTMTFRTSWGPVQALDNVSLDVHAGEFVCLLGPSGCGKSTLLYALAGHFAPSGGRITIDGKAPLGPGPNRLLIFQEPGLFPWLNVRQNLTFGLTAVKKMRRAEADARAAELIRLVHLDGFEDAMPHELSGGMRQRTSLARALAMDPEVLLMDEPFAALDSETRGHMHQLLQQIWLKTRKTVVFVTHNVRESLVLGDRVVVMAGRPGRILYDLEVHLDRPRDPDAEQIVQHSREIREALRAADVATRRSTLDGTGDDELDDPNSTRRDLVRADPLSPGPLGGREPVQR